VEFLVTVSLLVERVVTDLTSLLKEKDCRQCRTQATGLTLAAGRGEEEVLLSPWSWRPRPSPDAAPSSPAVGSWWVLTT